MKTFCEHCVFLVNNQCHLDRLDKFATTNNVEYNNGKPVINTYCNTCRNVYWDEYDTSDTLDDLADVVYDEVTIKADFLIAIDDVSKDKIESFIKKTRKKYDKFVNKIVLFGLMTDENIEKTKGILDKNVIATLDISNDKFTQSAKYVHRSIANYLVFTDVSSIDKIDFDDINEALNMRLKPYIYQEYKKSFVVSTFFYKSNIHYNNPILTIQREFDQYGKPKSQHSNS